MISLSGKDVTLHYEDVKGFYGMTNLSQDNRFISISDFSLGKDTFLLSEFSGTELISGLFHFHAEVFSENNNIDPNDVVGKTVTITINNDLKKKFNGFVRSFLYSEIQSNNLRKYTLEIVPWLWFLTKTNDHRIFQDKSTKDIVSQIFKDLGFNDFDFRAVGGKKREYCVQHNESDFHFVSRLLEEDGIAYYFIHTDGKHELILVDQTNSYSDVAETNLEYSQGSSPQSQLHSWERQYNFKKGKWTLNDYNFNEPSKNLKVSIQSNSQFRENNKFEHYEYPGYYDSTINAELTKIVLEAEEADREIIFGGGNCSSFYAGGKFSLSKTDTESQKGEYILGQVTHIASDKSYFSGEKGSSTYTNNFICFPAGITYRPKRNHKKPSIAGPQSAIVVGPPGEDIYIDEDCRIKVQFIWDREGEFNENSSCYVRVMQSWAGNQWGTSFIPRIDQEVIVTFLDGDPDRPLVTGAVYNGKNKPTYPSKTQSGIKTRSTKGGTPENFNELRFEDKKGDEQIYLHAEKNFDSRVENDQTLTVDHDRKKVVGNNESSSIGNDRNKRVENNQSESIGNDKNIDVGNEHTERIGNNMSLSVGKNISIDISDNHSETVGKNMVIGIGNDLRETVDGAYTEVVTKDYSLKAQNITLSAEKQITFKTGSSTIVMKNNGDIMISGNNINVKGSGEVVIKGNKVISN